MISWILRRRRQLSGATVALSQRLERWRLFSETPGMASELQSRHAALLARKWQPNWGPSGTEARCRREHQSFTKATAAPPFGGIGHDRGSAALWRCKMVSLSNPRGQSQLVAPGEALPSSLSKLEPVILASQAGVTGCLRHAARQNGARACQGSHVGSATKLLMTAPKKPRRGELEARSTCFE